MSLKGLFHLFLKNDSYIEKLQQKINDLENQVVKLEETHKKQEEGANLQPPVIVEKINIERLFVDKFELNNNFGQLGIKELKGRLNIGATYGDGMPFKLDEEPPLSDKYKELKEKMKKEHADGPKVNIKNKRF